MRPRRIPTILKGLLSLCLIVGIAMPLALDAGASSGTRQGGTPQDGPASTRTFTWDRTTTLRNPGMGWMIYAEEFAQPLADADGFWRTVGPYTADASVLYLRVPWSRLEPTKGHYAWNDDANYQRLVAGARKRGLRLAFRVFVDSQDSHQQATPQFVFDAGAASYPTASNPKFRTPRVDDPVFRKNFATFIRAFAAQYDDPTAVDFVDMNTIGYWGEMHSIAGMNVETWDDTLRWLGSTYRGAFRHVLLALDINPAGHGYTAIDHQLAAGAIMRRDSFGSTQWFPQADKDAIAARWPASVLVAENCYQSFTTRATSCDDSFKPIRAMLQRVVGDALALHANYLDLRHPEDVVTWARDNPDLVKKFATAGGYRIGPTRASLPARIPNGKASLAVTWKNTGVGRLPNDNPQWDHKYAVTYALTDADTGRIVRRATSKLDPGAWIAGTTHVDNVTLDTTGVPAGHYRLGTAIVDATKGSRPAITLAVRAPRQNGWVDLGEVQVGTTHRNASTWIVPMVVVVTAAAIALGVVVVRKRKPMQR